MQLLLKALPLACVATLAACGGSPPPPPPPPLPAVPAAAPTSATPAPAMSSASNSATVAPEPSTAPPPLPPPQPTTCTTRRACSELAKAATEAGDTARAEALWMRACELGHPPACFEAGEAKRTASPPDLKGARAAYERACQRRIHHVGCARLARMASRGEGGPADPKRAAAAANGGCRSIAVSDHDRSLIADTCHMLGVAAETGKGRPQSDGVALEAFRDGCKLGHRASCQRHDALKKKASANKLPGANVNVAGMKVNGLEVKQLSCKTAKAGGLGALFGTMALAAGLAKRKPQLDRCNGGKRTETLVRWRQGGGRIRKATATTGGKRNACVERALVGAPGGQPAECLATIVHGR